jgi:hypothetical protein
MKQAAGADLGVRLRHTILFPAGFAPTGEDSLPTPSVLMEQGVVLEQATTCALQLDFKGDGLIRHNH